MNYLTERLRSLLGVPEALAIIHGGMGREDRAKAQEAFKPDQDVLILLTTDAAGEGINLQLAPPRWLCSYPALLFRDAAHYLHNAE